MNQAKSIVLAVVITAIVVGGGVYFWQKNQTVKPEQKVTGETATNGPLSYYQPTTSDSLIRVESVQTTPFDLTKEKLQALANECGTQHIDGYVDQVVAKFSGAEKTVYTFKYIASSQQPDTYIITLVPNKAGYTSLDQFKKDFELCAAGGDAYPMMMNSNWLVFESSCGTGFSDGSGRPIGCMETEKIVRPTIKLNE